MKRKTTTSKKKAKGAKKRPAKPYRKPRPKVVDRIVDDSPTTAPETPTQPEQPALTPVAQHENSETYEEHHEAIPADSDDGDEL